MATQASSSQRGAAAPVRRARRGSGRITLAEVARLAGVSPITASRALNTPAHVSPELLARVRAAVEATGYVPNLLAGGLASSRSRVVAALLPTIAGPVFLETIEALTAALAARGVQLMLGQAGYAESREDELLNAIIGRRPDGIVLTGVSHSDAGRRRLMAAGIPVVETWDLSDQPIDMLVGFSHERVGEAVAAYMAGKGYRRIAVITGNDPRAQRRAASFAAALAARGSGRDAPRALKPITAPAPTTMRSGRTALAGLLDARLRFDAVFCSSDALALGVLTEAQARGLVVPDAFGVVGFGDLGFAADTCPALTTVRIDGTRIGEQAASFILARAEGRMVEHRIVDVGFAIVERSSG